ncbi:LytR/AlgR family response regulator transcription factor [Maricaulis parjimensis]|uniref:LytR/AlgR family response regulator transcription factor n=1 Tax=Maricaulis parjimensis TaxID=144023 RepID=UPI001939ABD0|nr:LytTR family DNA-binding domain-containing protein [Maricaulis parjimensis]
MLCLLPAAPAAGQSLSLIDMPVLRVCPPAPDGGRPDRFDGPDCQDTTLFQIDPQFREIWVEARIIVPETDREADWPLGLLISGKAASEVWLNGESLGRNGQPGPDRAHEIPGRMDAVFYVPRARLQPGENELVLHLSGMHSHLRLSSPMHGLFLMPYGRPVERIAAHYGPALVTFGFFALGFVFFGVMAWRSAARESSAILALASFFAGGQLLWEVSRGLFAYDYPVHDIRLIGIVVFAFGFGLCLNAYVLKTLSDLPARWRYTILGGLAAVMLAIVLLVSGFDGKTGFSLLAALLHGAAWCAYRAWRRTPGALSHMAVFAGMALLIPLFGGRFLDIYLYVASAGILLFLFYRQAQNLVRARQDRQIERERAQRLETALAEARQRSAPAQLQLVSSGRVDYVPTDTIVQLKGAGDYVEVHHDDGRTALYNGSLAGLETELPATFLRVHRSHIVNTAFVSALERDASGVGRLMMSNGSDVPVSRRIMPKVRTALAAA